MPGHNIANKPAEPVWSAFDLQHLTTEEALRRAVRHYQADELAKAETIYRYVLKSNPDQPFALHRLGLIRFRAGDLETAESLMGKAISADPNFADAFFDLGQLVGLRGKPFLAYKCYRRAVALDPENDRYWYGLVSCLERLTFTSAGDDLVHVLWQVLGRREIAPAKVMKTVVNALLVYPKFKKVFEEIAALGNDQAIDYRAIATQLSAIPLFLRLMEAGPIVSAAFERILTRLRGAMARDVAAGKTGDGGQPFAAALALQCYGNGYVFFQTAEEEDIVGRLQRHAADLAGSGQELPSALLTAIAAYVPLDRFAWADQMLGRNWDDHTARVVERLIAEPFEERRLRERIPRLTPIDRSVSKAVREQYEENPYPSWTRTGVTREPRDIAEILRGPPYNMDLGDYESPANPEILIAGCGTGQHAITSATMFKNARVLAVDLSLTSLSYALRKTQELGLSNLEYGQADIMELGGLERQFDVVESVGVLHHLGDPMAGWRLLVSLLRPGGLMRIGLYSEFARREIVKARSKIAELGYSASNADIRAFRHDIARLGEAFDVKNILRFRDYYSMNGCRDLLFHVQEHRFTFAQLDACLKELGLRFLGLMIGTQTVIEDFKKKNPQDGSQTSLALWDQYEAVHPDSFRSMYQFWCRKI